MQFKITWIVFILIINAFPLLSQITTLRGKVVDAQTQQGIPYANIGFPKYSIGITANEEGEFILKIPQERLSDTLVVSTMGYVSFKTPVNKIKSNNFQVFKLETNDVKLKELVVKPIDADDIIDKFFKNLKVNYNTKPAILQSFCRETIKEVGTNNYFLESEGVLELYKSSVKKLEDQVRFVKGRKKNLPEYFTRDDKDIYLPKIVNGPTAGLILDVVKNNEFFLHNREQFKFTHDGYTNIQDRLIYIIAFEPKDPSMRQLNASHADFFKGKIYIDVENFALVKADFIFSERGLRVYNTSRLMGNPTDFPIEYRRYRIDYESYEGKYYLKSAIVDNSFKHMLININHKIEYIVTKIDLEHIKEFPKNERISVDQRLGEIIQQFDDSYWGEYNILKSSNTATAAAAKETIKQENVKTDNKEGTVGAEPKPNISPVDDLISRLPMDEVQFLKGSLKEAKALAKEQKKYIFIDVYTDWCKPCKIMASEVFHDEEIAELMNPYFINLKINAEKEGVDIARTYGVRGYPTTLIIDSAGVLIQNNLGYSGKGNFIFNIANAVKNLPGGSLFLSTQGQFDNKKTDFNYLLLYARMRKSMHLSNKIVTDAITKLPDDSLKNIKYQQLISAYAQDIEGKTFDFILKNKNLPVYRGKLDRLIKQNLQLAIHTKNKSLLKKILKANTQIIADPSVSDEKNEQLALEYYEKVDNDKEYHETASILLEKYYVPKILDAKTNNNDKVLSDYLKKLESIGVFYVSNIKNKKQLEEITALINRACTNNECVELVSIYSQLLYRIKDVEKAKELMKKAISMSNNAATYVDILDKMSKGEF